MRWKLRDYLDRHDLNPHQLVTATGLSTRTVYPMTAGSPTRVDLHSLETIVFALRKLTSERVELTDLLELEEPEAELDLGALIRGASRSTPLLEGTGGKPKGSGVRASRSVADAVVEERDEREQRP